MNTVLDNKLVSQVRTKITGANKKIVVPEGEEIRVIKSLEYTKEIHKILIGDVVEITDKIKEVYPNNNDEIMSMVSVIDPRNYDTQDLVQKLVELRKGKLTLEDAQKLILDRVYFATMLLQIGEADALVGGSFYATADILRPAFQIIKPKPGTKVVSSFFLMTLDDRQVLFADCAVNLNPTAEELKDIAIQTVQTALDLNMEPKVALLSYSTKNSGKGESVTKVQEAYQLLQAQNPDIAKYVDGELQFDAAYAPRIAEIKAPDSSVAGQANVFVFPNLESGNIGYKIAQEMGGWDAVGPLLQGLNKPVNDLSRGTTAETIAQVMYLSLK